jgi:hypothetical protein
MSTFDKKLQADLKSGKVALGGCEVDPLFPKYRCNSCKYEFSHEDDYIEPTDFDKKIYPVIEAYIDRFGSPLLVDFEMLLDDPDDGDEWVRVIQKAIDDNQPFDDEGIELIIDDSEIEDDMKNLGIKN